MYLWQWAVPTQPNFDVTTVRKRDRCEIWGFHGGEYPRRGLWFVLQCSVVISSCRRGSKVLGNVGVLRSVAIRKTSTCGGTRGMSILGFYFLLGSSHEQNGRLHMIGCKSLKVKDQMWRPVIALPLRIWEVPSLSLGLVVGSSDWDIAWCSSVPPH